MNRVYLSGMITEDPRLVGAEGGKAHLVFPISVFHRARNGIRREIYNIHAWDRTAAWGLDHLRAFQRIAVQGYLTQSAVKADGDAIRFDVAVTADEFFPGEFCERRKEGEQIKQGGAMQQGGSDT